MLLKGSKNYPNYVVYVPLILWVSWVSVAKVFTQMILSKFSGKLLLFWIL